MKLLRVIAFLIVVVLLAAPVLGQIGGGMMGGGGAGGGIMGQDMMRGKAKEMMTKGSEIRGAQGMMGMGFMHSQGSSYGNYVTFSVDNNTGEIKDYGILGITVFDSINVSGFDFKESRTMGALTRIISKDGSSIIQLHDNPAAVINIRTKMPATITFDLADGVNASKQDNIVKIEVGNLTAFIAAANSTSINIDGGAVKIGSVLNAVFRAIPVNMPAGAMHQKFMGEMMRNRAGAEISIGASDKSSITNYSEGMNVMIRSMDRGRMRMTINSTDPSGKFFMMNLDNSSMMWNQEQRVRLYIDNRPMRQVMTPDELFDANESCFWLNTTSGNRLEAMMLIRNFSERVVDVVVENETNVTSTSAGTPVSTTPVSTTAAPGPGAVLVLVSAGIAFQLRRKIRRKI